ncbi:predicted protein, partial [Nematostella vectensis]
GMVGDLVEGKAEMALTTLQVSSSRQSVIDFADADIVQLIDILVMPVKHTFLSVGWFGFLRPFQDMLWVVCGAMIIVFVLLVWLIDRCSPYGHTNQDQVFTLCDSFSYVFSSVFKIGLEDVTARSPSARLTYAVFSLGTLVLISTYTANLMASLLQERFQFPITGIFDPKV